VPVGRALPLCCEARLTRPSRDVHARLRLTARSLGSQQARNGIAWLISNRLQEFDADAACLMLDKLSVECAKDKWGRLPASAKSAVVQVVKFIADQRHRLTSAQALAALDACVRVIVSSTTAGWLAMARARSRLIAPRFSISPSRKFIHSQALRLVRADKIQRSPSWLHKRWIHDLLRQAIPRSSAMREQEGGGATILHLLQTISQLRHAPSPEEADALKVYTTCCLTSAYPLQGPLLSPYRSLLPPWQHNLLTIQ